MEVNDLKLKFSRKKILKNNHCKNISCIMLIMNSSGQLTVIPIFVAIFACRFSEDVRSRCMFEGAQQPPSYVPVSDIRSKIESFVFAARSVKN